MKTCYVTGVESSRRLYGREEFQGLDQQGRAVVFGGNRKITELKAVKRGYLLTSRPLFKAQSYEV